MPIIIAGEEIDTGGGPGPSPDPEIVISTDTASGLREPYYLRSTPNYWPRGLECVLDYGGDGTQILHDRRRLDVAFLDEIGGLDDPDVVSENVKNPDRDGEFPQDASYSGRTLTLRGSVKSGNLNHMRRMYSDIKDYFDEIVEQPLVFRWLDWVDIFQDSNTMIDYGFDLGEDTAGVDTNGSGLGAVDLTAKRLFISVDQPVDRLLNGGEAEVTIRFTTGSVLTGLKIGVVARRTADDTFVQAYYDHATTSLTIQKVDDGSATTIVSPDDVTLIARTTYWLRLRAEGELLTCSIWDYAPPDYAGIPLLSLEHALSGGDEVTFPAEILGDRSHFGLMWTPASLEERIELFDVGMLNPGDAQIWCRKANKIESPESQIDGLWTRTFLITLRASNPLFVSRKMTSIVQQPTAFALIFPAGGSGLIFPADGSGLTFGEYLERPIINLGRSTAYCIIRMYGPMTNPSVYNPLTDTRVGVNGSIYAGNFIEFDTFRRIVTDANGDRRYDVITDDTNWLTLVKGENRIIVGAEDASIPPIGLGDDPLVGQIGFFYRHSSR